MRSPDKASDDPSTRSVPDRFESFNLSIERIGEAYRAQVTSSPVGPRAPVPIDPIRLDPGEPGDDGETFRDVRRRPLDRNDLRRIGERLFSAVFVGGIGEAFRASVVRVRGEGLGLRIRLQLDEAPELASLPWEALWDAEARTFLADCPDLPVVRALRLKVPSVRPLQPPLQLVALLPEPRGETKIAGREEWQQILEHLKPLIDRGVVEAERLEPSTLDALGKRIDGGPCHVLHVVAHGGPGDPRAGGLLKLEDESGNLDSVTGIDLARALARRKAPRLVVLNACHGARTAADDAFDGLAQHLLSRGVPAVVAMRTSISDAAAVSFAAELYRELARGRTVEAAMAAARRGLSLGKNRSEWATPVLYLRGENVRIFDVDSATGFVPLPRQLVPGRRRVAGVSLAAFIASLIASVIGFGIFVTWPKEQGPKEQGPCPRPPGLTDLRFVKIDPGVAPLADRSATVTKAYCIATMELSRRDWRAVMGGKLGHAERWPDMPMTDVTVGDAILFAKKLMYLDPGVVYRLPTAAEWEYAARAGSHSDYFFGDDPSELDRYGNCKNSSGDGHDLVARIGQYKPNGWGLYDVHGNVAEWVESPDRFDKDGRKLSVRLGGSFRHTSERCKFSGSWSEVLAEKDDRDDTGIRLVRELNGEGPP